MVALRGYQRDVIERVGAAVAAGRHRILLVAPTGSGKTVVGAELVRLAVARRERVLFIAHRRELVQQASAKLHANGVDHGIIQAGFPTRPGEPVQVASVQTLLARAIRGSAIEMPEAGLLIVDEAHHARARTYRRIVDACPGAVVLGLTATPCRGDGRGLGNVFEVMVECPPVPDLIGLGYLVATKVYAPTEPDLTGVRIERGDYVEKQIAAVMDRPALIGDVVTHWHRLAERRRTVVFASGVAHSVHLRDEFRRSGVWAEHIDGSTPSDERDGILARLARGEVEVVSNAMVLTEGWDCPEVGCLVLARPTRSVALFRQMVGRAMRTAPGKSDAILLDHAGAVFQHGLPEEPVAWTLDTDRRAENPAQTARANGQAARLTNCPECAAVRWAGKPCSVCGWRPVPRPAAVDVADGELGRVQNGRAQGHAHSAAEQLRFFRQLLWMANERGYKHGWAAHKFKEKFGAWPTWRTAPPEAPDDAVRSWVRSRQIAWAKAQRHAA